MLCSVTFSGFRKLCEAPASFTEPFFTRFTPFMQMGFHCLALATSSTGCAKPEALTERLRVRLDLCSAWHLPHSQAGAGIPVPKNAC